MCLEYRLLGPVEVVADGQSLHLDGKQRALLATVLVHANRVVSVPQVIEALWGHSPPPSARGTVQSHVMRLRRAVGMGALLTRSDGYLMRVEPGQLDRDRFDLLLDRAGSAIAGDQLQDGLTHVRAGLGLWRGRALQGVRSELLQRTVASELDLRRLAAIELAIDAELALGRHATVTAELRALVHEYPARERFHAQLMLALYRCGRQVEALEAYQSCRRALAGAGVEPGPDLRRLEWAILAADRSLERRVEDRASGGTGRVRRGPRPVEPGVLGGAIEFRVLGPLEVTRAGRCVDLGGAKQATLLAALLLRANQIVPVGDLIDVLWDDSPPRTARSTVHSHVRRLRRTLGSDSSSLLHTGPGGYRLAVAAGQLDLERFDELVAAARRAAATHELDAAASYLHDAQALWRGESALPGIASRSLRQTVVPGLEERRLAAVELSMDVALRRGRHAELIAELERLVRTHRARERFHEQLMLAYHGAGRPTDALAAFQRCQRWLVEEFGLEPSAGPRRLAEEIRGRPALRAMSHC